LPRRHQPHVQVQPERLPGHIPEGAEEGRQVNQVREVRARRGQDRGPQAGADRARLQLRLPLAVQGGPHDVRHALGPLHVQQAVQGGRVRAFHAHSPGQSEGGQEGGRAQVGGGREGRRLSAAQEQAVGAGQRV